MRVRCIAELPTLPQSRRLGRRYSPETQAFPVSVGKIYPVYGVETYPEGTWLFLETDLGYLVSVPLVLFELVEPTVSKGWEIRATPDGDVTIGPKALLQEHFLDDLSDGVPEALRQFREMKDNLAVQHDP